MEVLDACIGVVEARYGKQPTYEALTDKLRTEFPKENYTLTEVIGFYGLSSEIGELQTIYKTLGYG